ncbi:hypothetical protein M9Y10_025201 [Tritrichomonas musculus]|uniref:Uncharacterized protein n=1 Tax=Tritrichomonas musculus TaxID=1915356 RepID=A0ABR2H9V3_9EUKA
MIIKFHLIDKLNVIKKYYINSLMIIGPFLAQYFPIDVTEGGMITSFNDVQSLNKSLLIFVTDDGSSTTPKDVQLQKTPSPIDLIVGGRTTFVNDLQFEKALFPMFLTVGKNVTSFS